MAQNSIELQSGEIKNYESRIPVTVGALAGVGGALAIMATVLIIMIATGESVWMSARMIASTVYGPEANTGIAPILVGTIIHLFTGGILGVVFAYIVPRLPRSLWLLAGVMYGMVIGIAASAMFISIFGVEVDIFLLLVAHMIYGLVLGVVGAGYGLFWGNTKRELAL